MTPQGTAHFKTSQVDEQCRFCLSAESILGTNAKIQQLLCCRLAFIYTCVSILLVFMLM